MQIMSSSVLFFFFFIILLSLAHPNTTTIPNITIEDIYRNSLKRQPQPYTLEGLYGYKPIPDGIDFAYGWHYGKSVRGIENEKVFVSQALSDSLNLDFYWQSCPNVEDVVLTQVKKILATHDNAPAQLLRLFFHDCFIEGCDASILLTDTTNQVERDALPNHTLKGFEFIEMIKIELEKECPGIVSCADILAMATRDSISKSGGLFYPILTGRRDSRASFFGKALAEIPRPLANLSDTLQLFTQRGFTAREMVALLGGHNIGRISCNVTLQRLVQREVDPFMSADFAEEIKQKCRNVNDVLISPEDASSPSQSPFGPRYYDVIIRQRGLLFSDMQLMTSEETASVVAEYASEADGTRFQWDFSIAMVKMSNLQPLTGSRGEIRNNCSVVN